MSEATSAAATADQLRSLLHRCDAQSLQVFQGAASVCASRTHYEVTPEHLLLRLLDETVGDVNAILSTFKVDRTRIRRGVQRALDQLPGQHRGKPALSPKLVDVFQSAAVMADEFGFEQIRPGLLLLALVLNPDHVNLGEFATELERINVDQLRDHFHEIVLGPGAAAAPEARGKGAPAGGAGALEQFTVDLTAKAQAGQIDPVFGRDPEIRQMIDILGRRRKNNPIIVGEPGTGKTAIVEGLALRIVQGDVPPFLRGVRLVTLDLGLLQAGAGVKGEFENRLRGVIDEVKASPKPIIVFIDEAHQLIGAGGSAGQGDAANLLKPALARGELRTIAATTWAEYKKYFEKDAALTRRFQVVKVDEPPEPMAVAMVRGLVDTLEKHHNVRILDEAVTEAVRLSARYIPSRQLPDKAVSLIDTACARVGMSQAAVPPPIEDRQRRIALIDTEVAILDREIAAGEPHGTRRDDLLAERARATEELAALEARWEQEKTLATELGETRAKIEDPASTEDKDALRTKLTECSTKLRALQGETPLIYPVVDRQAVAEVVEGWTGIPAGRMQSNEIRTVLNLKQAMEARIVGQPHALDAVAQAIRTSRAGLTDPRKPIGVFLMVGTSGTGKTETALTLADLLYGGEQNMTVINMTEFKEEHKVSLLMGSPPGYVGYGEGGVLTEAVRRRPYSVILLDEMEKAHPGVQDIFFQVFDKGNMKDGEGRDIDFKNTVIIMTSNAGTDLIARLFADPETAPDAAGLADALMPELMKFFKPAFLGRVNLVPYFPLSPEIIRQIVELQLNRVRRRVQESYGASFAWDRELADTIAARCTETSSGARNVEKILSRTLLPELSAEVLSRLADGATINGVTVGVDTAGSFQYHIG